MINSRTITFLTLCEHMNYRASAEALHMTQPAVTQHIHYLEEEYGVRLFQYDGRRVSLTENGEIFRRYALSVVSLDRRLRERFKTPSPLAVNIGATKTIGDYVINDIIVELAKNPDYSVSLIVENTEILLKMLDSGGIDLALIEGFFDKNKYGYKLYRKERFVGVCAREHRFAGRVVKMTDLFPETFVCREKGSGTRAIFEQVLSENNYTIENFARTVCISSFEIIKQTVMDNAGISFLYE